MAFANGGTRAAAHAPAEASFLAENPRPTRCLPEWPSNYFAGHAHVRASLKLTLHPDHSMKASQ